MGKYFESICMIWEGSALACNSLRCNCDCIFLWMRKLQIASKLEWQGMDCTMNTKHTARVEVVYLAAFLRSFRLVFFLGPDFPVRILAFPSSGSSISYTTIATWKGRSNTAHWSKLICTCGPWHTHHRSKHVPATDCSCLVLQIWLEIWNPQSRPYLISLLTQRATCITCFIQQ